MVSSQIEVASFIFLHNELFGKIKGKALRTLFDKTEYQHFGAD